MDLTKVELEVSTYIFHVDQDKKYGLKLDTCAICNELDSNVVVVFNEVLVKIGNTMLERKLLWDL